MSRHGMRPRGAWRRILRSTCAALALVAAAAPAFAQGPRPPQLPVPPPSPPQVRAPVEQLRVFLDCQYQCDEEYLVQNVSFIDYVRDRTVADIHVLVTTQSTGGGGLSWVLKFIGLGRFQGVDRTFTLTTQQTDTSDDQRRAFARVFKLGLVGYMDGTRAFPDLDVTWTRPEQPAGGGSAHDPWHFWAFRLNTSGSFSSEQSTKSRSYRLSFSANRTTGNWKITSSLSGSYSQSTYTLSDGRTVKSLSDDWSVNVLAVKSVGPKWSVGARSTTSHSTFSNSDLSVTFWPGVEYDVFPYSESSRRSLTIRYFVGPSYYDFHDLTIFDRLTERVGTHEVVATVSFRQPWGSLEAQGLVAQQLNHADRYRATIYGSTDVRLFKGFSFNIFGEYDKINDQISLKKGGASQEDILLRLQQLATNYSYFFSFGITYSFGSIFTNVVNPRFGG